MCMRGCTLVVPTEVKTNNKATAAMRKEWGSFRELGAWDESTVQEWSAVEMPPREQKRASTSARFSALVLKMDPSCPRTTRAGNVRESRL